MQKQQIVQRNRVHLRVIHARHYSTVNTKNLHRLHYWRKRICAVDSSAVL